MQNTNERTLEALRSSLDGHIYLRFHSQSEYDDFLTRAQSEGFAFGEHLPTEHIGKPWDIISLGENKQLAFCGAVSHMAYASGAENVHRVDYAKFAGGETDYIF